MRDVGLECLHVPVVYHYAYLWEPAVLLYLEKPSNTLGSETNNYQFYVKKSRCGFPADKVSRFGLHDCTRTTFSIVIFQFISIPSCIDNSLHTSSRSQTFCRINIGCDPLQMASGRDRMMNTFYFQRKTFQSEEGLRCRLHI